MSGHKIITIGRQFGSGGREIGQKLAERLGIPLYDRRLVTMAAEALGVREEDAERVDESSLNSFVSNYTVSPGMYMEFISATPYIQSFDDEVYKKEAEIIQTLAEKGPCIIVGRCADYILRETADCLSVFIHASDEKRAERIVSVYGQREDAPVKRLHDKDKKRRAYYELYTGTAWGDADNYALCLDSGALGIETCVEIMKNLF